MSRRSEYAPVALFVYARPAHTARTLKALAANALASETDLYVYADAARSEEVAERVQQTRELVRQASGFRTVTVVERETNMGLARSIVDGVTRLCVEHGRVIVVEDDLVTAPYFLDYMNRALERYADNSEVMQVAAYNVCGRLDGTDDACFLPFISSWGWATWARAWRYWDADPPHYDELARSRALRKKFDLGGAYPYFDMLKAQREGRNNSWAIRWYLTVFSRQGVVLYPRRSLVENIGFDGSGEHCGEGQQGEAADHLFHPLRFPSAARVDEADYRRTCQHLRQQQPPAWRRRLSELKQKVRQWSE